MSEQKSFKLRKDFVVPAGTVFTSDKEFKFSEGDTQWLASGFGVEGYPAFSMVTDIGAATCDESLFEVVVV